MSAVQAEPAEPLYDAYPIRVGFDEVVLRRHHYGELVKLSRCHYAGRGPTCSSACIMDRRHTESIEVLLYCVDPKPYEPKIRALLRAEAMRLLELDRDAWR